MTDTLSTPGADLILLVALAYVIILFGIAWYVDWRAASGETAWLHSPVIYTLSLSVYCTAWTFYGAVGSAARSGLEFMAIYLGPTLVFAGWWWLIRKLVRIGRIHRITSIADMISSRYGKSGVLGALATIIAVFAATPYIALQLQSLTLSYSAITGSTTNEDARVALWAAVGLALFTILFGTRSLDENERHHGVVAAIAFEAVVKLAAIIAVGVFAVFGVAGGVDATFANVTAESLNLESAFGARWLTLLFLSATAIICLPRQFQVSVVENSDERQLRTASWMFPLYLLLISFFVLPIALVGASSLPSGSNPDMFVLTLPLLSNNSALAILTFIGGLSAATSMVIVSTIALSTMVSNHIVAPLSLIFLSSGTHTRSGDVQSLFLTVRRVAIVVILALGYTYFLLAGRSGALAATGLIAFCGVAQFLPALIAGIFWRHATRTGAITGLICGFVLWFYTLYLPSFGGAFMMSQDTIANGPFGISALRPQALLGLEGADPLVHATTWSVGVNASLLILISLCTGLSPMERLQSTLFVDVFRSEPQHALGLVRRSATSDDLYVLAQRILGSDQAGTLFRDAAFRQGKSRGLPDATDVFISGLERELAGSVGAASAHTMVGRIAGGATISTDELLDIADENAQLHRATEALRLKSQEAEQTARQLLNANNRLVEIDAQKDEFLSHVSHELRTPMTSVRSFAEILKDTPDLQTEERERFAGIIQSESMRLTRLLDEIRDLNFLDDQPPGTKPTPIDASMILESSAEIAIAPYSDLNVSVRWTERAENAWVSIEGDRLAQICINLISNAILHSDKDHKEIRIGSRISDDRTSLRITIEDNGPGIPEELGDRIFEPFVRGTRAGSAGLGLAISMRISQTNGGNIRVEPAEPHGARFIISLPLCGPGRADDAL